MTRATVCLTVDLDAVSSWIHSFDAADSPTNLSRGVFGADVGTPRLLDLFATHDLEATWFVPGHTVESFPATVEDVWARGHDVQHHGWSHTRPSSYDDEADERADVERGVAAIESVTGQRPTGYRSPSWDFSANTLGILQDLGFAWDSSQMARDFEPYYLREGWRAPPDAPYDRGTPTDVVEVPVSWQRDDYPAFAFSRQRGYADETAVFEQWRQQFDWMYRHVDGGVYVLTLHPQVSGQSHRLANLDPLLDHVRSQPDVAFSTVDAVAEEFAGGDPG